MCGYHGDDVCGKVFETSNFIAVDLHVSHLHSKIKPIPCRKVLDEFVDKSIALLDHTSSEVTSRNFVGQAAGGALFWRLVETHGDCFLGHGMPRE
jgi:hypothetical protein